MRYAARWIVLTSFFLVAAETPLPGQRVTGTITGRVTDNTGAVLPGANIIILNTLTQEERRTVTDETGSYAVSSLPGTYTVAAEVSGFKKIAVKCCTALTAKTRRTKENARSGA